jgi:hypothetical protein
MGLTLPDNTTSSGLWVITVCVFIEKFGWGFGAVGHMLYMMQQIAPGPYKTAHYAFATALLGFCMMVTGMVSAGIQPATGYEAFFIIVLVSAAPSLLVTLTAPFIHSEDDAEVGKDEELTGPVRKQFVLPNTARVAAIGAVLLLAAVGGVVAYMRATAFNADRDALSADKPACFERNNKRACYFQCDFKKEKEACAHLAELYASDAKALEDEAKYAYARRETWRWYEANLRLRCGDANDASTDLSACAELGTIQVDPEAWEDVVSRDADIAAGFVERACAGSKGGSTPKSSAGEKSGEEGTSKVDRLAISCDLQACLGGDHAKCGALCDSGYSGGCRQLAAQLEKDGKANEANQQLFRALTMRCDGGDATACHKLAGTKPAEAKTYYGKACDLGMKPDCSKR